jgi:hypothetical protein
MGPNGKLIVGGEITSETRIKLLRAHIIRYYYSVQLTLSARPSFQNFSTPCILNVNNTGAKQGSIMK